MRLILFAALVAVGCDAYFQQGYYTRSMVGQIEIAVRNLSDPGKEELPPTAPPQALPQSTPPSPPAN